MPMKDLTPEEVGRWLDGAPQQVQDVVMSDDTITIIEQLGEKYGLHIDQAGLIMKLVSYMLIGYLSPNQLLEEMTAGGIADATARKILAEINEKIFVPLREKMRGQNGPVAATTEEGPAKPVNMIVHPPLPTPDTPMRPAPSPPPMPRAMPEPPANLPGAMPPLAEKPAEPKPLAAALKAAGVPLLEDREEPHIELRPQAPMPVSPPKIVPTPIAIAPAPVAPPRAVPAAPVVPLAKDYATDPYREPIDEQEK